MLKFFKITKMVKILIQPQRLAHTISTQSSSEWRQSNRQKYLTACCISDEINIKLARKHCDGSDVIKFINLPSDASKITLAAHYKTDVTDKRFFIFKDGVVTFWNMTVRERLEIINLIKPFLSGPVFDYVKEEDDLMYCYTNDKTKIVNEIIHLKTPKTEEDEQSLILQQMALSEALSHSVKLGIYETRFLNFSISINEWINLLKSGKRWNIRETKVLQKTGELFMMRHKVTVSSQLNEVPDFYWERSELEDLFTQIRRNLNIFPRTKVLNERLNLYCELTEILRNHISSMHSTRLEIMIILLIMIEVFFECFSFYEKYKARKLIELEDLEMDDDV